MALSSVECEEIDLSFVTPNSGSPFCSARSAELDVNTNIPNDAECITDIPRDYYISAEESALKCFNSNSPIITEIFENSLETFLTSSTNTISFTDFGKCPSFFSLQKQDAFTEWIDAKQSAEKHKRKIKMNSNKSNEIAQREKREKAESSFQQWLNKKKLISIAKQAKCDESKPSKEFDSKANFTMWLSKKNAAAKLEMKGIVESKKMQMAKQNNRKQLSVDKYNKWLLESRSRTKPVPFNQGLLSLRGATLHAYINPNEWISQ